jgi:hypothetical protein
MKPFVMCRSDKKYTVELLERYTAKRNDMIGIQEVQENLYRSNLAENFIYKRVF